MEVVSPTPDCRICYRPLVNPSIGGGTPVPRRCTPHDVCLHPLPPPNDGRLRAPLLRVLLRLMVRARSRRLPYLPRARGRHCARRRVRGGGPRSGDAVVATEAERRRRRDAHGARVEASRPHTCELGGRRRLPRRRHHAAQRRRPRQHQEGRPGECTRPRGRRATPPAHSSPYDLALNSHHLASPRRYSQSVACAFPTTAPRSN